MRILQVIPYFSWVYGGPVRVVFDLAHALAERNHEVTIYATDVGPVRRLKEREKIKSDGTVNIRYFKCLNNWIGHNLKLQISREMRSTLKTNIKNFDIIHTHESRGVHNLLVWHYARKYGVPYVLQAHGAVPKALDQQGRMFVFAKHLSDAVINERVVRDACKAVALTKSEALAYEEFGVEKTNIKVVPNGLRLSQFEMLPARGEFRTRYGIESGERIILFLGRIHKTKGLELLLRAFCKLQKALPDVRLAIAGPDGGYLRQVREDIRHLGITNNVLLTGPLYADAKLEAFVDADAYVLPSSYDIFGLSAIEACACGIPTILTNRCGVADVIKRAACVIDYDEGQLKSAMYTVLTDAGLRERMKREGPVMVRECCDVRNIVDDVEKLYRICICGEGSVTA
jgi:glycosyltransferase involved in cell wall biosynthesis